MSTDTPNTENTGDNPAQNIPPADETPAAAPAAKRKVGRPSNAEKAARAAGNDTAEKIEAGSAPQSSGTGKSSKSKSTKRVTSADIGSLAKQLVGLHQLGALLSGIPEVVISDAEGAMLASGIVAVCEEYDLSIDGKTGAALQLLGAAAMVYAPKAFKISARMQAQKKARENQPSQSAEFEMGANGNVYPTTSN